MTSETLGTIEPVAFFLKALVLGRSDATRAFPASSDDPLRQLTSAGAQLAFENRVLAS